MTKTVVLGSEGFIGKAVCGALARREVCHTRVACSSLGRRLDVDHSWVVEYLEKGDRVFLCAGRTGGVGRMAKDPFSFVYPNVRIHMNLFQACAVAGVRRVVCVQSTTGYPDGGRPMREDEYLSGELHPAYFVPGNAHRFILRLAQMHEGLEVVFFRPSNVYGPRNSFDPQNSHVIEATVRKVAERQDPFVIWGDGSEVRDAVYVDDLAEAMAYGLDCAPGAYNVACGEEMDVNGIAAALLEHAGFEPRIEHDLSKPTAISARRLDISKTMALGWSPTIGMRKGLALIYDWYIENREQA